MKIALDTNAYRKFTDGDAAVLNEIQLAERIALPFPVLAELRAGFALGSKGLQNERILSQFLDSPRVDILYADEQTTRHYAQLYVQLRKKGTPIPINDIWIAALVLQHNHSLITFDTDFDQLPQIPRCFVH